MALTRITKGVIKPNENYDTHNINSTGIVTAIGLDVNGNGDISGNLSVGGVLTYEDVTSIDSVGVITARQGIHVGAGVSAVGIGTFGGLDINGDLDVDGHTNLDNLSVAGVSTFSDGKVSFDALGNISGRYINLDQGNGTKYIDANLANGNSISLRGYVGSSYHHLADFIRGGLVGLNYSGNRKLETSNTGVTVTGTVVATGADINGDLDVDGHTNLDNVSIAGITTHNDNVSFTTANGNGIIISKSGNYMAFGNSVTQYFGGTSMWLQHNGSTGYVHNVTGGLYIRNEANNGDIYIQGKSGEHSIICNYDGDVQLYYDGGIVAQTTQYGFQITNGALDLNNTGGSGASLRCQSVGTFFVGNAAQGDLALYCQDNTNNSIILQANTGEKYIECNMGGSVDLYHHGNKKIETIDTGAEVTGNLIANHSNGQVYLKPSDGSIEITRTGSGAYIDFKNSTSEDYDARLNEEGGHLRVNTNFRLYDNKALELGNRTSSTYGDLRLFHDASDSYIENHTGVFFIQNTGDLRIRVDNTDAAIHCVRNGAVELHHAGNKKFETSSTGITVTGNIYATGGQLTLQSGNEEQIHRFWTSGTDSDINGLLQNYASSSTFGTVVEGAQNGHHVIALRDNDNHDSFAIISGSSNYMTDTTYDKIIARFKADGKIIFGGNTTNENVTLEILPGGTAGNYSQLVLGRTSSAPTVQTTAVVKGGNAISGVPGIIFGSSNTNLPCVSVETPNSSNGHIVFKPKGTEKVRFHENGRVTIGDSDATPAGTYGLLHLYQASNDPYMIIQAGGAGDAPLDLGGIIFRNNTNQQAQIKAYQSDIDNGNIHFYTNYGGSFADRAVMTDIGTLKLQSGHTEEKLSLQGSGNPLIRFKEATTNRAYIGWNATGDCLDIVNQQDSSGLRIKDALQFTQDGSTYYNVAHTGNYISHGENYTAYFVGTNTSTQSVIDEQKVRFYKVSIDGVSNYGGVNYVDIVRSGVHDNNGIHGMWVGSMDVRIKCRFSNCGNGSHYSRFVHNYHANTSSVTQGQGGGNIARIDTYLACLESSRLYVWLRGQLTYYIRVNGRPATIHAIDMNDYRTTMHSSVMPSSWDGEGRDALSIMWGYQGQTGAGRKLYGTSGGVEAQGNVSATGSKPFKIPHPLVGLSTTKNLVHAAIEGPQCDNIYRGKTTLVAGKSIVNIDTSAGMTEGTFATLNRDVQCFTTNETGWTPIKGSVSGNQLTILAQDNYCTDTISWMVVGERQDDNIVNNTMTDSEGHLIVEPDFEEIVEPDDPGTFAAGSSQIGEDGSDRTFTQPLSS